MTFVHYTENRLHSIQSSNMHDDNPEYVERMRQIGKPVGLWISPVGEYDWPWWCRAEGFRVHKLKRAYEIKIREDANLIRLQSDRDIDAFTEQYSVRLIEGGPSTITVIDWARVMKTAQGIIIAPYSWERRMTMHTFWYYGWDCASGCIWDKNAIQAIRRRKDLQFSDGRVYGYDARKGR
jgi:hypothetical protein